MLNPVKKRTWAGLLETSTGTRVVIYDARLPEPPTGQVYLYLPEREAYVPHLWNIVRDKLRDMDTEQARQVIAENTAALKRARREFLRTHPQVAISNARKTRSTAAVARQPEEESWEGFELEEVAFE